MEGRERECCHSRATLLWQPSLLGDGSGALTWSRIKHGHGISGGPQFTGHTQTHCTPFSSCNLGACGGVFCPCKDRQQV